MGTHFCTPPLRSGAQSLTFLSCKQWELATHSSFRMSMFNSHMHLLKISSPVTMAVLFLHLQSDVSSTALAEMHEHFVQLPSMTERNSRSKASDLEHVIGPMLPLK